jgi:hypothetical protein
VSIIVFSDCLRRVKQHILRALSRGETQNSDAQNSK